MIWKNSNTVSKNKFPSFLLILILAGAVIGLTLLNYNLANDFSIQDNFAPRWAAAKAWMKDGESPYSKEVYSTTLELLKENDKFAGEFSKGYFLEPAFNLYFYIPLSFLPYPIAKAILITIIEIAILGAGWASCNLARVKLSLIEAVLLSLAAIAWYPNFKLILSASVLPIFVSLVLIACVLAQQKKGTAAGILLFICIGILPISIIPAIFFIIWRSSHRDHSVLSIYLAGIAFLLVSSLILFPGWMAEWSARLINTYPDFSWIDTPLMRIGKFFPGASFQVSVSLHVLTLFYLLVEWFGIIGGDERIISWKIMLTLGLLTLFNPTSTGSLLMWAWPGLLLFFRFLYEKWRIFGKILGWIIFIALIYTHWVTFAELQNWTQKESSIVVLLLPFIALIGLEWTRWWAMESTKPILN